MMDCMMVEATWLIQTRPRLSVGLGSRQNHRTVARVLLIFLRRPLALLLQRLDRTGYHRPSDSS